MALRARKLVRARHLSTVHGGMAMDLVVGTSGGIFLANSGQPAGGVNARIVRQLIQVGDDLFAAGADGVYRSASGGQDWTRCGVDAGEVWNLGLAPSDQGLYAGTQPAHLFVSRDKGDSWQEVPSFLDTPGAERWCVPNSPQGARALALAFDRFNSQRMWVGVEVGGVVTTEDGGAHWSARWVGPNADVHLLATHP